MDHSTLPSYGQGQVQHGRAPAMLVASAMRAALANPYLNHPNYHFAQVNQYLQNRPNTTAEGYSLSSTYVPAPPEPLQRPSRQPPRSNAPVPLHVPAIYTRTGPGGPHKCIQQSCPYAAGSKKDVEIHMMDRHLIYPPGWRESLKAQPDSDLPPNMPILGTNIRLDTPEAIEAWILDRRKRWPTSSRIKEKEENQKNAADRGEIRGEFPRKRRRIDGVDQSRDYGGRTSGRGRGRRGRGLGRADPGFNRTTAPPTNSPILEPTHTQPTPPIAAPNFDDDSGSDMDPIFDAVSSHNPEEPVIPLVDGPDPVGNPGIESHEGESNRRALKPLRRVPAPKPKETNNPFVNRPPLLRKLLQHEIRSTISNFSQAIRFLVENDFLQGVELTPGSARKALITEIGDPKLHILTSNESIM